VTRFVREWSGTADSVRQSLEAAAARGQLVSVEPLRANAHGVAVRVVLRPAQRTTTDPRQDHDKPRQLRPLRIRRGWEYRMAAGVALLGSGAAAVWLLVEAGLAAWAWLLAHLASVVGTLALLVAIFWALGKLGVCPGVHCPGCRHS
jgi:hypothetical protein